MARTPTPITPPAEAPQLNEAAMTTLGDASAQLAALQAGYGEERDLLNQLLGQAQMADAFANFSRTVRTSKLAYVRENKLYRALKGTKTANGSLFSGTWDEFCELLGTSRDKVELDIANLRAFGEEALESMSKMGIGYRELRQYRRLPEDQKQALIEVAKAGDKEGFVELAEEIIARHVKVQEAAKAEVLQLKQDSEFVGEQLQKERERADKAEKQLAGKRPVVVPLDERITPFQVEITERQSLIEKALGAHEEAIIALENWWTEEVTSQSDYDPESTAPMPRAVRLVLMHLDDAVTRSAHRLGALRNELDNRFGPDIAEARQFMLAETAEAESV